MSQTERTEEPTPRKLRRARERGEVPQSPLAAAALVLIGVTAALAYGGEAAIASWRGLVELLWADLAIAPGSALVAAAGTAGRVLLLPLGVAVACGAAGSFLQVGPLFTMRPLAPDPSRLGLTRGLTRAFSWSSFAPRLGVLALVALLAALGGWVLWASMPGLVGRVAGGARFALGASASVLGALLVRACALLAAAGALAIAYRRWRYLSDQRMTRRELREEQREAEGEPLARRRRVELLRAGALGPTADEALSGAALVVRGSDRAVVLRWDPSADDPPSVSLTARGALVARVALRARVAGVPAVHDEALARELERLASGRALPRPWLVRLARHLARCRRPAARASR